MSRDAREQSDEKHARRSDRRGCAHYISVAGLVLCRGRPRLGLQPLPRLRAAGLGGIQPGQRPLVYLWYAFLDILGVEEVEMAKTLIDVDERYLAAAQEVLHTKTKKDTVNAALREVAALAARRRDLQRLESGGLPDLEDEEVMRGAWRQ
jgi:Arc/MetJ family transcription regulator